MHKNCILLLILFISFSQIIAQTSENRIAVLELEASGLNSSEVQTLTEQLRFELQQTGAFTVIERQRVDEILKEQGFQQTGCSTSECAVEIGRLLNVNRICAGNVGKVGSTFSIVLRLIDVETGMIVKMGNTICQCPIDHVLTSSLKDVANQLASTNDISGNIKKESKANPVTRSLGIEMVKITGGTFEMGDKWDNGDEDELPLRNITLKPYSISKYEITQILYKEVVGRAPSRFKGINHPVECVTWYDAVSFCNLLSKLEGLKPCYEIDGIFTTCDFEANGYRLPTEAEWEFAGMTVMRNNQYGGSESVDSIAWYEDNSERHTHDVGTKQANDRGLYDTSGNVWEWCWDWYNEYTPKDETNPTGPSSGEGRVIRGGAWDCDDYFVRIPNRDFADPTKLGKIVGFRIARTL